MPANPGLPLLSCELCDFATKNAYMFKRHTNRCRRDHGLPSKKKKKPPSAPKPVQSTDQAKVKPTSLLQPKKYTYTCAICQFTTCKSRVYLDHKNDVHGENNVIYDCPVCEYASKWKSKLTNHVRLFHPDHVLESVPAASLGGATVDVGSTKAASEAVEEFTVEAGPSKIAKANKFKKGLKLKIKFNKKPNLLSGAANSLVLDVTESQDSPLFKCKLCSFSARRKWKVYKHAKAGHVNTKKLRCPICSYICFGKVEYEKHKQNHSSKIMYKCNECSYTTHLKPNHERHLRSHNRNLEFKCEYCSYSSTNQGAVKRHRGTQHIDVDGEIVPQDADEDEMETESEQSLIGDKMEEPKPPSNEDAAPEPEVLKCTYCGFLPREEEDYRKHMARHRKGFYYPCQLCGHMSRYNSDINRHFREKHDTRLKIFIQSQGVTSFVYTSPKKHTIKKPPESRSFADELMDLPDKSYRTLIIGGKERIKCSHCSYIAKWPCDLRRHLSVHSIEKRYKCPKCMKKYKYVGDLNVHLRRDHKVDPSILGKVQAMSTMAIKRSSPKMFRCPTCPYKSQCKSDMDRHSRLHSEEKPFQCKTCDYQTHWRSDIRRHVYRHHIDLLKDDSKVDQLIIIRRDLLKAYKNQQNYGQVPSPLAATASKVDNIKEEGSDDPEDPGSSDSDAAINSSDDEDEDDAADAESSIVDEGAVDDMDDRRSIASVPSKEGSVPRDGSVSLQCEYCDFSSNAASKMNAHVATHLNIKRFRCPVCGKRSNWKWDISKHMRNAHRSCRLEVEALTQEEAEATIKEYMDTNPTIKREHHLNSGHSKPVPKSDVKKPFKCSLCDYKSHIRWDISRHLRTLHSGEEGSIIISIDPEALREVMNSPQKASPSAVSKVAAPSSSTIRSSPVITSPRVITSPSIVQSPAKRVPLDKQRVVSSSSEGLPSPQYLKEAARRGEKNFKCGDCGKRTTTKGDIKKHYHYMHPGMLIRILYVGNTPRSPAIPIGYESPAIVSPKPVAPVATTPPVTVDSPSMIIKQETCYSDPKKLGYIKPFKCSVCGRRSNWKWDCNKHIRICHSDTDAYVITMSEEEARLNPTPKIQNTTALLNSASTSQMSSGDKEDMVSAGEQSMESDGDFSTPVLVEEKPLRQFQCSVCLSRSNWRSDLHRHIKRKHGSKGRIIILDPEVAQASLESYHYPKEPHVFGKSKQVKHWQCIRCPYKNEERLSVVNHLSVHNVKPYSCKLCGAATNYRSAMYRHIRHRHGKNDFTLCTVNLRHIREGDSVEETTWATDIDGAAVSPDKAGSDRSPGIIHRCKLCTFQSSWKSALHRHLREKHACTDYGLCTSLVNPQPGHSEFKVPWSPHAQQLDLKKKYSCTICPYRSAKPSLLKFHMTHHKSKGQGKYKCKYCPYWVCARRLAAQHQKLHADAMSSQGVGKSLSLDEGTSSSTLRRHICDKCPYTTNSKNDYLYHKQFHRPKPVAEYKCDYCDYWVTHKRLLKQHLKIHNVFLPDNENEVRAAPYAVQQSPCKSEFSETSIVYDAVEIASIKQRLITAKITASLSQGPVCSPLKVPHCTVIASRPGYLLKNGVYRKLHKCRFCPYTNVRTRNLKLHEKMHGRRKSDRPLMKCPHCDYHVGARGLLSHHLKVHQQQYVPDVMDTTVSELEREETGYQSLEDMDERGSDISDVQYDNKVDTMLEIARFKKWCCEKCPYASARRTHFERHLELHGSKQRYMCDFCDYSVPSSNLLAQHKKLHMMPNQNLLAVQSILNLQHLPEVPADMMLASSLPRVTDSKEPVTYNITHDHMDLYENAEQDTEPRKLYRCDRCPYANVRRDHLLAHIKNHMLRGELACPYCDYSVAKQHHLVQHIRVHFSPLPELSSWLCENGQSDRAEKDKYQDISEAVSLAQVFQKTGTESSKECKPEPAVHTAVDSDGKIDAEQEPEAMEADQVNDGNVDSSEAGPVEKGDTEMAEDPREADVEDGDAPSGSRDPEDYVCQYCDRVFSASEQLIRHELQHLIGNQFERFLVPKKPELCSLPHTSSSPAEDSKASIEMVIDPCVQDDAETMATADEVDPSPVAAAASEEEEDIADSSSSEQTDTNADEEAMNGTTEAMNGTTDGPENHSEN